MVRYSLNYSVKTRPKRALFPKKSYLCKLVNTSIKETQKRFDAQRYKNIGKDSPFGGFVLSLIAVGALVAALDPVDTELRGG
jgi:hypothetical protein